MLFSLIYGRKLADKILRQSNTHSIFTCSTQLIKKNKLPPRPKFDASMEADIEEKFLHGGTGPGGQKINKCNSKVQIKHVPSNIVVTCQATRSRDQNRKIAREKLALELERWQLGQEKDGNSGVQVMTEREQALLEWKRQQKRSKGKKSRLKHELAKQKREEEKKKELDELMEVFGDRIGNSSTSDRN
ncbi:uncharacterized protein GVI51_F04653 [Nakaseomyces glabratus]|uniref:Prokaryotic-type class I peptide chain release factors domain-containing protein n=1 Tax=Candida glabrata (strain ATCC 2001 / BCRC 20586 / JCM 3761 / NBRC 0622 / NRRL Y-65 / CBS 138) TaxID=284593 RepID=Q6FUA4_CANGA|nr:uncharacterized protein CAGL0F05027g [Nakaseomyces glabratus]KAH7605148.1 RF-1 domain [Nakaseomyces glabratus]KAH7607464.1 RF-1 domain [Nakaseomyces glabratus]KAI8387760.1 RF-1 domain [Nakaseomyces glabratus]KTB19054.1 putative peptide chain release factor-like protein [Nakaseomyces glabratus]KTB22589.1 putative peptide chain release factor-like protein [Nakaseomyces glabratus]|eukprot:XP_446190.1 uncharacterized protein CAGL0F05027g [[Candida] glabrata]